MRGDTSKCARCGVGPGYIYRPMGRGTTSQSQFASLTYSTQTMHNAGATVDRHENDRDFDNKLVFSPNGRCLEWRLFGLAVFGPASYIPSSAYRVWDVEEEA